MHFSQLSKPHLLIPLLGLALAVTSRGQTPSPPAWWATGTPAIITGAAANNKGPANIGQAKYMVSEALRNLDIVAPTIAAQIAADLAGTPPSYADQIINLSVLNLTPDTQKAPLRIGQLKAISAPFYTRIHAVAPTWLAAQRSLNNTAADPTSIFPWTSTTNDDANKALATIGQLKAVFSLRFESMTIENGGAVLSVPPGNGDTDGDGISDSTEITNGTNYLLFDTDGDGISDGEDATPLLPNIMTITTSVLRVLTPLR